jgi:hypothetical protein
MRVTFLCCVVLLIVLPTEAAPAPDRDRLPKQKLEALKKRLPDLVSDWLQKKEYDNWLSPQWTCKGELRVLRRVGPEHAKAVILFAAFDDKGTPAHYGDVLLTVFLSYHDGCWTTERYETAMRGHKMNEHHTFAFLMLAIDEAAEK